ncbi:unnamed protein product [Soboliphyme baturini]|uniref:SERPIN domain-containing protein n=1 Tax=Soboliphyme baturini TaxID=241478 RepID=A0A183IT19_9BILA|nr:unnamed protein product [Soboliphyme baturini]
MEVFSPESTRQQTFYASSSNSFDLDMMSQMDDFHYGENDECQVLVLKYDPEYIAMNVFLPKEKFGLEKFEKGLTGTKLKDLMNSVSEMQVTVTMPKFKFESDVNLKDALKEMGITEMFTDQADLSVITGSPELLVSDAKHKTFIEVDENGTKAAAVTAFKIVPMSLVIQEKEIFFTADHPFMFAIVDRRNGNILFMGRYTGKS